jgi:uncharacterized HAD superfamily protein
MLIGFDIDGIIYNYHQALYDEMVAMFGLTDDYDTFWTKTMPSYSKFKQDNLTSIEHIYANMPPSKEIIDTVKYFAKKFGEVFYVTARPESCRFVTYNSMKNWGFPCLENLYIVGKQKDQQVKKLHLDIFVEDRDKHALELKDICKVYLVKKPWNVSIQEQFSCIDSIMDLRSIL